MEFDDGAEDEGPLFAWLPPEDRLWRHPSEMPPPAAEPPTGRGRSVTATLTRPRTWTLALAAGLAGALFASGFFMATGSFDRRTTVLGPVVTPNTVSLAVQSPAPVPEVGDWQSITSQIAASLVSVQVSSDRGVDVGSGVLWGAGRGSTYVLTAGDLVSPGGPITIEVAFNDGRSEAATLVGADALTGIAVLATAGSRHSFPTFGSVSNVEVAEPVLAVGARASGLATGIVSGLDADVPTDEGTGMAGMLALAGMTVPDSSDGGALVDEYGEVVGIDTVLTSAEPGETTDGYAVPIDTAVHVARQIVAGTSTTHPWLGVDDATDLSTVTARQLGVAGGAQVGSVDPASPAQAAGLQAGDIITRIGHQAVVSTGSLLTLLAQSEPGRRTSVTYLRDGVRATVPLTIGNEPATGG